MSLLDSPVLCFVRGRVEGVLFWFHLFAFGEKVEPKKRKSTALPKAKTIWSWTTAYRVCMTRTYGMVTSKRYKSYYSSCEAPESRLDAGLAPSRRKPGLQVYKYNRIAI